MNILLVLTFIFGTAIGCVLTYLVMKYQTRAWFERWKIENEDRIRKDVIERSRASLKGRVGEQFAPISHLFNHEPSDARFIGSPVDYVVFDGHSKETPVRVTFVEVKTGEKARLNHKQKEFKKIVENGKVRWETLNLKEES